jgi:hypothetical protein
MTIITENSLLWIIEFLHNPLPLNYYKNIISLKSKSIQKRGFDLNLLRRLFRKEND